MAQRHKYKLLPLEFPQFCSRFSCNDWNVYNLYLLLSKKEHHYGEYKDVETWSECQQKKYKTIKDGNEQ